MSDNINERNDHTSPSSYQVVARRYRPQDFSQLIGQASIAQALSNAITTGRIGHAYLFTGARGVGKTSSARIFAKALNCVHGPTTTPCNQCDICLSVSTGDDVDVIEIDGASNRGISDIQEIRQNAKICPSRARFKIYIIDEVHALTKDAFNALLKTLEEPPEHVKFIFCTTEPNKLPITILSRCQRFDFAGIDANSIALRLRQILEQEGADAEDGVCEVLARRANGSMRDAQSLLEQLLALAPQHIHLDDVHQMLGSVNDQQIFDLLHAIAQNEPIQIFTVLHQSADRGVDFGVLLEQMMGSFRDLMVVASGCSATELLYCSPSRFDELRELTQQLGLRRILASLQLIDQTGQRLKFSNQGRILLELALVRLANLDHIDQLARVIQGLRSGKLPDTILISSPIPATQNPVTNSIPVNTPIKTIPANPPHPEPLKTIEPDKRSVATPSTIPGPTLTDQKKIIPNAAPPPPKEQSPGNNVAQKSDDQTSTFTKYDPASLNDFQAKKLWDQTLTLCGGTIEITGKVCSSVHFEKPDKLIIIFPMKCSFAKQNCEKEQSTIRAQMLPLLTHPIELKFQLDTTANPNENKTSTAPKYKSQQTLIRELEENPLVQRAKQLFGAELKEVSGTEHE